MTPREHRRRIALVTAGALATIGSWSATAAPAAAEPVPEHGHFEESFDFDDAEYCAAEGVTFHVVGFHTGDFTVTFNRDGSLKSVLVHHYQHVTFTANGKTLEEDDRWTNIFYPDGSAVTVGAHTHIRGDSGIVLRDAGRIVEGPDGSVEFIAGKHPQFLGTTFCEDLLP